MSVHTTVREKLYCAGCQNVFCAACKADHSKQACQVTPQGSITEEQLLAAVSNKEPSGEHAAGVVAVFHCYSSCQHHSSL